MESSSGPPESTLSFGPLRIRIQLLPCGSLASVSLPDPPPDHLLPEHLAQAQAALLLYPLATPASRQHAAFRSALWAIPKGTTQTYGSLAQLLGTSPRAVGSWCAANRLLLRIPCHRVCAAHGPGGFRAGPLWKQTLIALESAAHDTSTRSQT